MGTIRPLVLALPFLLGIMLILAPISMVTASPSAFPIPFRNADYGARLMPVGHATRYANLQRSHRHNTTNHTEVSTLKHHAGHLVKSNSTHDRIPHSSYHKFHHSFRRQVSDLDELMTAFTAKHDNAMSDSQELQTMASQSASRNENDQDFHQNAAARFSSFQSNSQGFLAILSQLAADKGLANYDKNDQLETLLKDFVNASKNAVGAVYVMIKNDPTLGPILGPIVYELKCLIDETLDATENLTDGMLNALNPEMRELVGLANSLLCLPQIKVLGLCL
ncbi:uncharacterized protein FOMMEDRAFT_155063 [Fomitiporia mediterranea MF3/22]|uniref:uncharacterized protein n=1 Tax=Fomitiporia mediterranea (strain MF3/22) TaxID=694068 RepID=UPI0004407EFA|nr:uncharacterized protein FOMMEDRAFT_155063 [Fomitiporia mediterranea MF3/22]EJD03943.1 hypothetical protein FOMMEDRAFT_155063 [Fomitiporia mediterranea MF3/22]